jgi:ubiquinone/menaquinone biosynthesis C-methylase UbiE
MAKANRRMIAVWDGDVGRRWVADRERYELMDAPFGDALRRAADVQPGHVILDVGCGFGASTIDAAQAATRRGSAVGVDISGPMLAAAEADAADRQVENVAFRKADAQVDDLGNGRFDVAISQFGLMFFHDPVVAFANIHRALRPGGRLIFTCWQDMARQAWLMVPLMAALEHIPVPDFDADDWSHAAFSLAEEGTTRRILAEAGFDDVDVRPIVAPQYQGSDLNDTLSFLRNSEFAESVFAKADASEAIASWDAIASALAPYAAERGVLLEGAAWLVQATRP